MHLMPGSTLCYIRNYRITHSRWVFLDTAVQFCYLFLKKVDDYCVVMDIRKLNSSTIPERYPMPRLEDIIQSLGDSNIMFSTLDLQSGFFQVELEESSRLNTTFTTNSGQFMFKHMEQGLRNSLLTFQRLRNSVLSGLLGKKTCFVS